MYYALVAVEVILAIVIVVLILLQPHEGEGMGSVFGGSSGVDTFLGTKTITVLWKATIIAGIVFICIAILLNLEYVIEPPTTQSDVQDRVDSEQSESPGGQTPQGKPKKPSGSSGSNGN